DDGAPFKITPHQFFTFIIDRQTTKLHQRQADDYFRRVPYPDEVVEQRYLPALECLDEERLTQIIQVAIGLGAEGLLKRQSLGETAHGTHRGAWTASGKWAYPPAALIFFFWASTSMP